MGGEREREKVRCHNDIVGIFSRGQIFTVSMVN